ncbi:hypothetical protein EI94DRAFT_1830284 [Lactarius quietus]|nr:hypothetical protein EI94DRAFT_1830284 [Lactarius quietus]
MPYGLFMERRQNPRRGSVPEPGSRYGWSPFLAGLFSAVLTSFLVQSIQTLQLNPADQSVYYQNQSAYYQQQSAATAGPDITATWIYRSSGSASPIAPQFSTPPPPHTPLRYNNPPSIHFPPPYPTFEPSFADIRVNACWLVALVCSLSAALLAILIQQWVRSYMLVFQRDLQSPYQTLISRPIFFLMQKFPLPYFGARFLRRRRKPTTIESYQEELVMEETEERKDRDVRAVRWLVDNTTVNAEMEPLVLAIPGTFNTEWGREVWIDVASQRRSDYDTLESQTDRSTAVGPASLIHYSPRDLEGTAGDTICRCVRYLFETCKNHSYFENEEARHRRMRACVEAAASLVCCIDFQLDRFGEVGKLVSEIGRIEKINQSPTTTSDQSFIIRWTCLSLVSVQQILSSSRLQVLAGYAVSGLARFLSEYGQPDEAGWRSAQKIEECLKTAWERVEELRRAFEPWTQKKTRVQVEEILRKHERQISDLERIKVEADGMEDVDWRIYLYQDAMDEDTYRLARQLPGVSFDEPRRSESFLINDTFKTPVPSSPQVTPQLIFPGQQVQVLARLGLKLREVLDGQDADEYKEVLESLKFVDQVPVSLRRPDGLMKRQLWRLQDLRDGGGLGFTTELFFLSLRQLLSIPSLHESNSVFYTGAFKIITSHWEVSQGSLGTQRILLNIICDLIIQGRGVFSDFSYPEHITTMLFDMVGNMLQGYAGPDGHVRVAVREIASVDSRICMDMRLQRRALAALPRHAASSECQNRA